MRFWAAIVATAVATAAAVHVVELRAQDRDAPARIDAEAENTRVAYCAFANAIDKGTEIRDIPPEVMARFTLASSWKAEDLQSVESLRAFFRVLSKSAEGESEKASTAKTADERAAGVDDAMVDFDMAFACSGALGTGCHQLRVGNATEAAATLRRTLDVVRALQAKRAAEAKGK